MKILFTSGVRCTDRPGRWKNITEKFWIPLASTFKRLGHECWFATHERAYSNIIKKGYYNHYVDDGSDYLFHYIANIVKPDMMFCWNGNSDGDQIIRQIAREYNIKTCYGELGWFPQKNTLYFDPKGANASSEIRGMDFSNKEIHFALEDFKTSYKKDTMKRINGGYVFVPLQDERDTNIFIHSPFKTMNAFVAHVSTLFHDEYLLVRRHPRRKDTNISKYPNVEINNDAHLHTQISRSKFVVGINSTVLLESLVFGKKVVSYGNYLATGTGAFIDVNVKTPVEEIKHRLKHFKFNVADKVLSELIFRRSMHRKHLRDQNYIKDYYLWKGLI